MKSLETLIKLEKARVDDHRRMLVQLQDVLERIEQEIAELIASRLHEEKVARTAPPAERLTLEPFLAQLRLRLEQLTQAKADANAAIETARERLAEVFETQKRYEIIRDQRAAFAVAEEKRQEQLTLDETAAVTHQRKED
ncbi:MAG: flagellar FliJ family protein [Alphaproteobacteria bacterium]|nr:flagellar FliJ family protein [Alphaproteobacteria bacterium]